MVHQFAEFGEHGLGGPAPVRGMPYGAGPHLAAQIDGADGEMVHADLRADPGRTVRADREGRPGTADPAGPLGTQLLQQT
ncbi:hypothetical protein RKD41_001019 [Streptomyces tendae]